MQYIDGRVVEPESYVAYCAAPGEGVDAIVIDRVTFSCHSVYWLYRDVDAWVGGAGSLYPTGQPPETLFFDDGRQAVRVISGMPDLPLAAVKLGWWRPGEPRP